MLGARAAGKAGLQQVAPGGSFPGEHFPGTEHATQPLQLRAGCGGREQHAPDGTQGPVDGPGGGQTETLAQTFNPSASVIRWPARPTVQPDTGRHPGCQWTGLGAWPTAETPVVGLHRTTGRRFPFSIYYRVVDDLATVVSVPDSGQNPAGIRASRLVAGGASSNRL